MAQEPAKVNVLVAGQKISPELLQTLTPRDLDKSSVSINILKGDTVSSLVSQQWNVTLTMAELDSLISDLRKRPQNEAISSRASDKFDLRPGDVLTFPQVIAGRPKVGTLILTDKAVNELNLKVATTNDPLPEVNSTSGIFVAGMEPARRCDSEKYPALDAAAIAKKLDYARQAGKRNLDIGPIVAILDTGYNGNFGLWKPYLAPPSTDAGHPDRYRSESGAANIPLREGHDQAMVSLASPPSDHATHISGLVLGGPDYLQLSNANPLYYPKARIVPIVIESVTASGKSMESVSVVDGLDYARGERHAKIVNLSLETRGIYNVFNSIQEAHGVLFVVAAGNGRTKDKQGKEIKDFWQVPQGDRDSWVVPGMLGGEKANNVISVAAHTRDGSSRTMFSAYGGRYVDIFAPGDCVDSYSRLGASLEGSGSVRLGMSGTSQAAAVTSFAASLVTAVLGVDAWTPQDVKSRILATASIPLDINWDDVTPETLSRGNLDIERAVSIYDDIVAVNEGGKKKTYYGTLYGYNVKEQDLRSVKTLCEKLSLQLDTVYKIVPQWRPSTGPKDPAHWELFYASKLSDNWQSSWNHCPLFADNFAKIWLKTAVDGKLTLKEFQIADVLEIIPRVRPPVP